MMPEYDLPKRRDSAARLSPQLIFGGVVIIVGVLFLLDELGIVPAAQYARYWPVGLVAVGVLKLWQSRDGFGGALAGLIFTVAGLWLLLEELAVIRISFFDLWPLLLVFFGAYLVWQGVTPHARPAPAPSGGPPGPIGGSFEPEGQPNGAPGAADAPKGRSREWGDSFTAVAVLGGASRRLSSQAFRRGDVLAVMGGCEIDLRRAAIHGEAAIDLFAMWGGIEIRVPEDWMVDSQVIPLLGGVDDKTRPPTTPSPHRLVLRGMALMGGVEIKN
jgi:predicted membrane protein